MTVYIGVFLLISAIYLITLFSGLGISFLLSSDENESGFFFAFWLGIAQTAFFLMIGALLGFPINRIFWIPLLSGGLMLLFSIYRRKFQLRPRKLMMHALFVTLFVFATLLPTLTRNGALTSWSTGNLDLYDYIMAADYIKDREIHRFLTPLGQPPAWPDATLQERVVAWQVPSTRWVSYFYLAFLSVLTGRDVAELFTLFILFLIALFIPVIYLFAKERLALKKYYLAGAMALVLLNPHILYIAFHGFLPQIASTGFLICAIYFLEDALTAGNARSLMLFGIFSAGVLGSYPELFTFLVILTGAYCAWKTIFEKTPVKNSVWTLAGLIGGPVCIFPYQAYRYGPMMIFNTQILFGGWEVTQSLYLFFFMLGGFFTHPHFPKTLPAAEWALGPVLAVLFITGIVLSERCGLLLAVLLPFVMAAVTSAMNDWNYRYFKNFTYAYYLVPLIMLLALQKIDQKLPGLARWKNVIYSFGQFSKILLVGIALIAGAKSFEAIGLTKSSELIPTRLKPLEKIGFEPGAQPVLLTGLHPWQGMWAAYYLRNKIFEVAEPNPYMRSDSAKDGRRYPYILTTALNAERYPNAKVLFESDNIRLIQISDKSL